MPAFQQQSTALVLLSVPVFLGAALLGYQVGAIAWRRRREQEKADEELEARQRGLAPGMQHHRALRQLISSSTGRGFGVVKRVYCVPGGGPGSAKDGGYPPWTAQRVASALQRYDVKYADTTAFLALGAGSMNAASARGGNGHVIFESSRIAEELARGGVPPGSIIADFASWDTVGNAWFARMAVEALLDIAFRHGDTPDDPHASPPPPPPPLASASAVLSTPRSLPYPGSAAKGDAGGAVAAAAAAAEAEAEAVVSAGDGYDDVKKDDFDRGVSVVRGAGIDEEEEVKGTGSGERDGRGEGGEKLPAARAGEAYGGGEMRKWMFAWKAKKARARRGPLNVTVFVSDFHAERMDVIFQWVFGLKPSLLDEKATVTIVSLDTPVEMWARGPEQRQARQAHEREAAEQARLRAKEIRTVEEFRAFLMLGGHKGYFDLSHGRYQASAGGGWGGTA